MFQQTVVEVLVNVIITVSDSYNKKLSARRAQAVKNYLIQNGVDADRIMVRGEGKSFKYNNQTPEGRYANRRAEIIFSN